MESNSVCVCVYERVRERQKRVCQGKIGTEKKRLIGKNFGKKVT
jgi:hypothetical protein